MATPAPLLLLCSPPNTLVYYFNKLVLCLLFTVCVLPAECKLQKASFVHDDAWDQGTLSK